MPITTQNIDLWSEAEQAIVSFDVELKDETDEGGNTRSVVTVSHGDEVHRFSPNTTDAELQQLVAEMNKGHQ